MRGNTKLAKPQANGTVVWLCVFVNLGYLTPFCMCVVGVCMRFWGVCDVVGSESKIFVSFWTL